MSITDELRSYAEILDNVARMTSEHDHSPAATQIRRIADSIDLLHEAAVKQSYEEGLLNRDERVHEAELCRIEDFEKRIARIENLLNHKTRA